MITLRRIPLVLAAILVGYLLLLACYKIGYVSMAGADDTPVLVDAGVGSGSGSSTIPAPIDPIGHPDEALSAFTKLWRSGAITSALIVAAFIVLTVLRAKVAWFGVGYRAAVVAALIGGLGTLVDAIQRGLTPNLSMIIVAASTAIALFLAPKPQVTPA